MDPSSGPPSARFLRDFAATRVCAQGLRRVAREIGLHQSGLKYFLDGGTPRQVTLRKLQNWYLRVLATDKNTPAGDTEALALTVLVRALPPERRDDAMQRSVAFYRNLYQRSGAPEPLWLRKFPPAE